MDFIRTFSYIHLIYFDSIHCPLPSLTSLPFLLNLFFFLTCPRMLACLFKNYLVSYIQAVFRRMSDEVLLQNHGHFISDYATEINLSPFQSGITCVQIHIDC